MTGPDPAPKKPARSSKAASAKAAEPAAAEPVAAEPVAEGAAAVAAEPVAEAAAAVVDAAAQPAAAAPAPVVAAPEPAVVTTPVASAVPEPAVVAAPVVAASAPVVAAPVVAAPEPAVVAAPVVATPAPVPASAAAPAAADPAPPPPATPTAPAGPRINAPDVGAAVDKAYARLRDHLTVGEIVAGLGALTIIVVAYGMFGFIFGNYGTLGADLVMVASFALLAVLIVQNLHVHDFGSGYRVIVAGLCLVLGLLAAMSFLYQLRLMFGGYTFDIGGLTWWAGAAVAVLGGLMVWREPR